ncbi:hypothetical protein OGAPHI_003639 [Ogataea philodendri]|uniref:Choline kinase N-terminal domain-containing protein n=1 Tax=Ogataea philodendri TaxID=1378263 RepID=A0A9P8P5L3_9ASCO|nr:uncharacterized protein OGAPHI_003639 [Ogataea philodendri]KAH3665455.1 hypothetical protein OGAPHI_003639 [Ogataea philodendri]
MERPRYSRKLSSSSVHHKRSSSRKQRGRRSSSSHSIVRPLSGEWPLSDEQSFEADFYESRATLDNSLPLDYFKQDLLAVIQSLRIPKWRKIPITESSLQELELQRISGALTNCVYKVTYKNYYPLLLRLYGANVDNIIDRESELLTLQRLSQRNIGPKLLGCFSNGRFEEFLNNSITLNKEQIREPKVSRMIARRMKELHNGVPLESNEKLQGPKVWALITKWVRLVDDMVKDSSEEDQIKVFMTSWDNYKRIIASYQDWLYQSYGGRIHVDENLKFCHNDTQYGNLLFYNKYDQPSIEEDDSDVDSMALDESLIKKASSLSISTADTVPLVTDLNYKDDKKLVVIDFEYAGPNMPAYDITNHFSEWMANYHTLDSFRLQVPRYPSREERINFLNTYVNYVPGSQTPMLVPQHGGSGVAMTPNFLKQRSSSVVNLKESDLPAQVIKLYNETIIWRASNSIFWTLWGVITKGSVSNHQHSQVKDVYESGPNGEVYKVTIEDDVDLDDEAAVEEIGDDNDDNFDYLQYSLEKNAITMGDLLQFNLITKDDLHPSMLYRLKILDAEILHV